jgi:hypothetical protein
MKTATILATRLKKFLRIPRAALVCYKDRKQFNEVFNDTYLTLFL